MPTRFRALIVATFVLLAGTVRAQECGTSAAPTCDGTCEVGSVCAPGQSGTPCECRAGSALAVRNLIVKLNFAKPDGDNILLSTYIPVPDGFTIAGRMVRVDVGGVARSFVLDAKGAAKSDGGQVKLSIKAKKGVVAAQDAKFFFKLSKANLAADLVDEGLTNADQLNVAVGVAASVSIDTDYARLVVPMTYKAKAGKTGKASMTK
jgi:hypothetical protein